MSVLELKGVSIRYMTGDFKDIGLKEFVMRKLKGNYHVQEFWADRNVTFSLEKGDMLGIIGSNGAGKSTLLKAVAGIMAPTEGSVHSEGHIAALLELASGFDGELTVRENAYLRGAMLGYTRAFMDEKYDDIISFAELRDFQDRPFKQLSSGMKSRLAFSIASLVQPDILILDEVLSVGDGAFRKRSEAKMREIIGGGATTILVSHSLDQVRKLCNKVLWLEKGQQIAFGDTQILCSFYQQYLDKTITLEQARRMCASLEGHYDWLVVGAGLFGAAFAWEMAKHGRRCLVIDEHTHTGGRAYGELRDGITVHRYGPHVFHTDSEALWHAVNQLTPLLPCRAFENVFDRGDQTQRLRGIPANGCGEIARKMLEQIPTLTGVSFEVFRNSFPGIADRVLYTGGIDRYFQYSLGHLEYESLRLQDETVPRREYQPEAVMPGTSPDDKPCLVVEHKHILAQASPVTALTWVSEQEWGPGREPFYPVGNEKNGALLDRYRELAAQEPEVLFGGMLGSFRYATMAETLEHAIDLARRCCAEDAGPEGFPTA